MFITWLKRCNTIYSNRSPYHDEITIKERVCGFILRKVFTSWYNDYLCRVKLLKKVDDLNTRLKCYEVKIGILTRMLNK